uniref:Uncharacterized protein n=1 Tax=Enterovibrio sp. FF_113 TaxID=1660266 RepID=A0A0H3ZIK2_9GAMM|nr:hypothetical protein [Enterovibrio sp. FF_113]AKN39724.1 hypothetical protein [Enterovibrio sp. FF_113]
MIGQTLYPYPLSCSDTLPFLQKTLLSPYILSFKISDVLIFDE